MGFSCVEKRFWERDEELHGDLGMFLKNVSQNVFSVDMLIMKNLSNFKIFENKLRCQSFPSPSIYRSRRQELMNP